MSAVFFWESTLLFACIRSTPITYFFKVSYFTTCWKKSRKLSPFIFSTIVCLIISSSNHFVLSSSTHVSLFCLRGQERKLEKVGEGEVEWNFFSPVQDYFQNGAMSQIWILCSVYIKRFTKPWLCPQLANTLIGSCNDMYVLRHTFSSQLTESICFPSRKLGVGIQRQLIFIYLFINWGTVCFSQDPSASNQAVVSI